MNKRDGRSASGFVGVLGTDANGKPNVLSVPGHDGRKYEVIVRRFNGGLTFECRQVTSIGHVPCKGQSSGKLCYHSLAALLYLAKSQGCTLKIAQSKDDATKLLNLGGNLFCFAAHQAPFDKMAWGIFQNGEHNGN